MLPAISLGLLAYDYSTAASVVFGVWVLYVIYGILTIPARLRLPRARRDALKKANEVATASGLACCEGKYDQPNETERASSSRGKKWRGI
jgi:hypothetical protein